MTLENGEIEKLVSLEKNEIEKIENIKREICELNSKIDSIRVCFRNNEKQDLTPRINRLERRINFFTKKKETSHKKEKIRREIRHAKYIEQEEPSWLIRPRVRERTELPFKPLLSR